MTEASRLSLSQPVPEDRLALPPKLPGRGFHVAVHTQMTYTPTGAPAFFFDVNSESGERIGIGSVILEPQVAGVSQVGHVCAKLAERHATMERLAEVGGVLLQYAFHSGVEEALIVVRASHQVSVGACRSLNPISCSETRTGKGAEALAFLYRR